MTMFDGNLFCNFALVRARNYINIQQSVTVNVNE